MVINIKIENKHFFMFSAIAVFLVGAGLVISQLPLPPLPLSAGSSGNPGHNINSVGAPSGCETNQILQWKENEWGCINPPTYRRIEVIYGEMATAEQEDTWSAYCDPQETAIACGYGDTNSAEGDEDSLSCSFSLNQCFYYWDRSGGTSGPAEYSCTCATNVIEIPE